MEKHIGNLTFKRVYHEDLQEGTRYYIERNEYYNSTLIVATLVNHTRIITEWKEPRMHCFPWTLKVKQENFILNFAVSDNKFYELIPGAQTSMETRVLTMILKQVDEHFEWSGKSPAPE